MGARKISYKELSDNSNIKDGLEFYVNQIQRSKKGKTFLWLISYFIGILTDAGYNVTITKQMDAFEPTNLHTNN